MEVRDDGEKDAGHGILHPYDEQSDRYNAGDYQRPQVRLAYYFSNNTGSAQLRQPP